MTSSTFLDLKIQLLNKHLEGQIQNWQLLIFSKFLLYAKLIYDIQPLI